MELLRAHSLKGDVVVPADKSISHRSIMFGALAEGKTSIKNFLKAEDCLSTIAAFKALGVTIFENDQNEIIVEGVGNKGFLQPKNPLDLGNSGTTMRLISGILASQPFETTLYGDQYLNKRPMNRVMSPLNQMGATITGTNGSEYAPLKIMGNPEIKGIRYELPVASAQVKSAILLAGLKATGTTQVIEKEVTRNHTEQMIKQFGGEVSTQEKTITLSGPQILKGQSITIPGDISSAAFFIVAGLIMPNSQITLKNVGINPTRTGILEVVEAMGGNLKQSDIDLMDESATLCVQSSHLNSCTIGGDIIPRLIDELPIIALLATQANGTTVITDAEELKVKETNRIDATAEELNKLGACIKATDDGLIIKGPTPLHGGKVSSRGDHRIGMMLQIAALLTQEPVILDKPEAISVSYPNFFKDLKRLIVQK